jgi:hypothetical protein
MAVPSSSDASRHDEILAAMPAQGNGAPIGSLHPVQDEREPSEA